MSLWQKLLAARNALNAGEKLKESATWKSRAVLVNVVVALLSALLPFVEAFQEIDRAALHDMALDIGGGVWGVYCLYNAYVHVATSDKVGFGGSRD